MSAHPVSVEFASAADLIATMPLAHWLVPSEMAYCREFQRWREHAAARILAKRVLIRHLRWPFAPRWHDVEILRLGTGEPDIVITGLLDAWRHAQGLATPGISMSHARGHAAALSWLPQTAEL